MLPLRDKNPSGITPWVTYGLVVANCLVFLIELGMDEAALNDFALRYGMVPSRVTAVLKGEAPLFGGLLMPAFTSMFLHGGWAHLIGNMWFLIIFGDNVEGRLGHGLYVAFYLVCGLLAGAAQYIVHPSSPVPCIGASGAIAGVLGAYLMCWPHARVITLVPIFFVITFIELPAVFVLVMWFLIQLLQGTASIGLGVTRGVAYWAHIGGFAAGLLLIRLLPARKQPRKRSDETGGRWGRRRFR